jgi:hypothetical protein
VSASYPPLPILNDDDLVTTFGADLDGIRRYRVLAAVLLYGASQCEAAATFGISERTVRNMLYAYRREGGIDGIRSTFSTERCGVKQRRDEYEVALVAALEEEPHAGGDRLWQLAREKRGASSLSRRTAYRILARLRAEREKSIEADDDIAPIRSALGLLMEDPPLTLGGSVLAQQLLAHESDQLLRGTITKQALHLALDRLRPNGDISTVDRDWWPYLICSGEYEAGQTRAELERDLALSSSTYSRSKRQGLVQITTILPHIIETLTESQHTRLAQRLPRAVDFVGRREEEAYYAWRLQTEGRAWVWGLPGSGKSALAAELAAEGRRYGQSVIWHTCLPGPSATLSGIMHGLLRDLSARDAEPLRAAPLDTADALDTLREQLLQRATVVVLDDVHRTSADETAPLFEMLNMLVERGSVRLLLISQIAPEDSSWPPLPGMNEKEAKLLWADLQPLPQTQWHELYEATAGFPQPLRRVAAAYRRAGDRARYDDWQQDVRDWAQEAIWNQLDQDHHAALAAVATLANQPWGQQYEWVLAEIGIAAETWGSLRSRDLIVPTDQAYRPHPTVAELAATHLDADHDLRLRCETVVEALELSGARALEVNQSRQGIDAAPNAPPAELPVGLALIDQIRTVLERSAAYLEHTSDQQAQQLAAELVALNSALPDLARVRR